MNAKKIAVCVKPVPDPAYYDKITVDKKTKRLQRDGAPSIINELDRFALAKALDLKNESGAEVTVFAMAPPNSRETLLETLALGADQVILISDRSFAGADTLATAYTLSAAIKNRGDFDLILLGNESSDGGTNQVAAQLGEWLDIPRFINVTAVDSMGKGFMVSAKTDNGINRYEVEGTVLCGVCREVANPGYAHLRGIQNCTKKPFIILGADDLETDSSCIGDAGSPTKAGSVYEQKNNKEAEIIKGTPEDIVNRIIEEMNRIGVLSNCQEEL